MSPRQTISKSSNPAFESLPASSASSRAPAIQPVQRSMFLLALSGMGLSIKTSAICRRPPGFRIRFISVKISSLSWGQVDSSIGDDNVSPSVFHRKLFEKTLMERGIFNARGFSVLLSFVDHFLSHIDPDYLAVGSRHLGGYDAVRPAPHPASTTFSAGLMSPNMNGFPVPAKDSIVPSGSPSSQWSWYSNKAVSRLPVWK